MPSNVLLLTGYWPAAGYSLAAVTCEGQILLIVPEDEHDIADESWADELRSYCPAPLDRLLTVEESVLEALSELKIQSGIIADRIGFEQAEALESAAHGPNLFRGGPARILRRAFPAATLAPADELLSQMRSIKTPTEREHIRTACRMAEEAFTRGVASLSPGVTETEVAASFRAALISCAPAFDHVKRCDGFVYCMSGPNSARAWGPYSRSRTRKLLAGDLVIVRCHCYADGYWADVTRTYHLGRTGESKSRMFEAIFAARQAVLGMLRPGVRGAGVDAAVRAAIDSYGFGAFIRHSSGHGAGFGTLDHTARPRLHPKSEDVLEPGMVLKLELGIYSEAAGGVRKSEMLAITEEGAEPLTPFQWSLRDVIIAN